MSEQIKKASKYDLMVKYEAFISRENFYRKPVYVNYSKDGMMLNNKWDVVDRK